jgi:hypothetical protein
MATGTYGRTNCSVSLPAMHKQREGTENQEEEEEEEEEEYEEEVLVL